MKRALVFGGGGSKGAYELGVWKALDELGMHFDIVTGTSIGAIIGAMYVQKQYDRCVQLWDRLAVDAILVQGVDLSLHLEDIMAQKEQYKAILKSYGRHMGGDASSFEHMLQEYFDAERFFTSTIDYGCMCVNVTRRQSRFILRKDMTKKTALSYIIASASCFPVLPMKSIQGELYIDGGYTDNVPIAMARWMGAEEIVAVDLHAIGKKKIHHPQSDLIYIEPHVTLGSFLRFDKEQILRNRILGYQDTMKKFQRYLGSVYTFPLADKAHILAFEDSVHRHIGQENHAHAKDKHHAQRQMLYEHVSTALAALQDDAYPCLRMLEMTAYALQIEDAVVWSFPMLVEHIQKEAEKHIHLLDHPVWQDWDINEGLVSLKALRKKELVYFLYSFLRTTNFTKHYSFDAIALLMKDAFAMSAFLYVMTELKQSSNEKDSLMESPSFLK